MRDFECLEHVLREPPRDRLAVAFGDRLILGLFVPAGDEGQLCGGGIPFETRDDLSTGMAEAEEDLVIPPNVLEELRSEMGQEVDVERSRRLRGRPFVRTTEEQVTGPGHIVPRPPQFVRPDLHAGNVCRGRVHVEHPSE